MVQSWWYKFPNLIIVGPPAGNSSLLCWSKFLKVKTRNFCSETSAVWVRIELEGSLLWTLRVLISLLQSPACVHLKPIYLTLQAGECSQFSSFSKRGKSDFRLKCWCLRWRLLWNCRPSSEISVEITDLSLRLLWSCGLQLKPELKLQIWVNVCHRIVGLHLKPQFRRLQSWVNICYGVADLHLHLSQPPIKILGVSPRSFKFYFSTRYLKLEAWNLSLTWRVQLYQSQEI